MTEYLPFLMLPVAFGMMFLGVQVTFAMLLTATGFGLLTFGPAVMHQFVEKIDDLASNFVFAAIPLFVFMGAVLEKSGIADRLFEAIHIWTRHLPGGLAIATVLMCVVFAASSGVIGATESVVGLLTIPIMLRYGYHKPLISGVMTAAAWNMEQLDAFVPHQANLRIIDATAERMGLSKDKVMINIDRYGNTTAGTIPICLSELYQQNKVKRGDYLVLSSFGAGYTWGAILLRWSMDQHP